MTQPDWVQIQAKKHEKLLALRDVIKTELERKFSFSEISVNVSLKMIRRCHGEHAETETRQMFGLTKQSNA